MKAASVAGFAAKAVILSSTEEHRFGSAWMLGLRHNSRHKFLPEFKLLAFSATVARFRVQSIAFGFCVPACVRVVPGTPIVFTVTPDGSTCAVTFLGPTSVDYFIGRCL